MKRSEDPPEETLSKIITQAVIQEMEGRNVPPPDRSCSICSPRQCILRICQLMYTRRLSDSAGGNISLRVGDNVYITPRYMGERHQWEITPDSIILAKVDGTVLEGGAEQISREGSVHFGVYRNFPEVGAVIHAHPGHCLVFACAGKEMPSVTAMAEHFRVGTVPLIDNAPPGSEESAFFVIEAFKKRRQEDKSLVVLVPNHGVVVAGKDIDEAYVILESVETNARVLLLRRLLETS